MSCCKCSETETFSIVEKASSMKVSWDKEHGWHIEHEGEIIAEVSDEAVYDKFSVPRSKERYAAVGHPRCGLRQLGAAGEQVVQQVDSGRAAESR